MAEKKLIGLDFTNNELRMVQLNGKGKTAALDRYSVGAIPPGVFQGGRLVESARFVDAVKELHRTHKFTAKRCVLGISGKYGVTRLITLPKMSAAQTRDAIQLQLNQYVPFPPGDTLFDYKVLREVKEEEALNQEILLVATRRSTILPILAALKKAGMNVVGIKITTLTAFTLFEDQYLDVDQAVAFVDVRDAVTDIAFISENYFRLSRSIEFGSALVADKIRQKIGATPEDVDEFLALNKVDLSETYAPPVTIEEPEDVNDDDVSPLERQRKSFSGEGEAQEKGVRDSVIRVLGAFVNELMRSIRFFESQQKRRSRVGKVVIFGNISYMENLRDYISEQTGLDTVVIEETPALIEMNLGGIDLQMYEGNEAKAIIPMSLAFDAIRSRRLDLNLIPRETVVRKKAFNFVKFAIVGFIVMILFMGNWYLAKDKEAQDVRSEVQEWDKKINQIKPFYDETEQIKTNINRIAPKVEGVLSLVKKQISWVPILEELGRIQLESTWLQEFSMDGNSGEVNFTGYAFKTTNMQRFFAILYYSNMFSYSNISMNAGFASGTPEGFDEMMDGSGQQSAGTMNFPIPTPRFRNDQIPNRWSPDLLSDNVKDLTRSEAPFGNVKPMYGLPELPRGPREIENFWRGRTRVFPIIYEFEVALTVQPNVIDTSSAAFEGLDRLSV